MSEKKKELEEVQKESPRKDEDMLAYSFNDKEKALYKIDKDGVRIPTLAEDISFVTSDRGADFIATQGVNGHQLEVSNIHIHNAGTLLERLNTAGCKENIPPEVLKDLEHKYLMTAIVDGKTVSKAITEQQFDKAMSLDDYHRFRYFNMVFGIEPGNSVRVPDIQYSQRHTIPIQLTEKPSQAMALEIVKKQAWYQRAVANGTELSITPISIGKDGNDGSTELRIEVNGERRYIMLNRKEYDDLLNANKPEDNALKSGTNTNDLKGMTENAYSAILEQSEAVQSQEQSMGMSR